jgi:hypothetical protein
MLDSSGSGSDSLRPKKLNSQPRRFGIAKAFSLAIVIEAADFFFSPSFGALAEPALGALGFTPRVGILEGFFVTGLEAAALLLDAAALLEAVPAMAVDLARFAGRLLSSSSTSTSTSSSPPPFSLSDVAAATSAVFAMVLFSKVNLRFLLPDVKVGESSVGLTFILFSKSNLHDIRLSGDVANGRDGPGRCRRSQPVAEGNAVSSTESEVAWSHGLATTLGCRVDHRAEDSGKCGIVGCDNGWYGGGNLLLHGRRRLIRRDVHLDRIVVFG